MKSINLNWDDYKTNTLSIRQLRIQEVNYPNKYLLLAFLPEAIEFQCIIRKTTPRNPHQIDYEDNYRGGANKDPNFKAVSQVCTESNPFVNNVGTNKFLIPAEGRLIGEGITWTNNSHEDDIYLVSIETPAGGFMAKFTDDDAEGYQKGGLRSYKGEPVQLSNLTNIQPLPGGNILKIQCIAGNTRNDTLFTNLIWGKEY